MAQSPRPGGSTTGAEEGGAGTGRRKEAAVGVVANEENIRQPQKAGSLCDVGTGVNIPVVPSREERCLAAGEGTAAAGTKPSAGRSGIPGRKEPWTGERPDGATSEAAVEANREQISVAAGPSVLQWGPQCLQQGLTVAAGPQCLQQGLTVAAGPSVFAAGPQCFLSVAAGPQCFLSVAAGPSVLQQALSVSSVLQQGPQCFLSVAAGPSVFPQCCSRALSVAAGPQCFLSVAAGPQCFLSVAAGPSVLQQAPQCLQRGLSVAAGPCVRLLLLGALLLMSASTL
ncbi:hypothetical protein NQZ68_015155 [Dissostichus eleginoides]|nr:hypothetical protein NQZ68_015155 [Dissostichus eleginoides]